MKMIMIRFVAIFTAVIFSFPFFLLAEDIKTIYTIGVLAVRGKDTCIKEWQNTADFLSDRIPGATFTIVPLDFKEVRLSVQYGDIDFLVTDPSSYVEEEIKYGIQALATLKRISFGRPCPVNGSIIFTQAERKDINRLNDIKGKRCAAVDKTSLGGWLAALREFKEHNIDPYRNFSKLIFTSDTDRVFTGVRDGSADAGILSSDIFSQLIHEGKIDITQYKIIEKQYFSDYSYLSSSTRIYPGWVFAKLTRTSSAMAEAVTLALFDISSDDLAAVSGNYAGWIVPLNYQSVHECLQYLRVEPYQDYGKITISLFMRSYWPWIMAISVLLLAALTMAFFLWRIRGDISYLQNTLRKETAEHRTATYQLQESQTKFKAVETQPLHPDSLAVSSNAQGFIARQISDVLAKLAADLHVMRDVLQSKENYGTLEKLLPDIDIATSRLKHSVDIFLESSRTAKQEFKDISLNEIAQQACLRLHGTLTSENITLHTILTPGIPSFKGNAQEFEYAISQLILNARWAIQKKSQAEGGDITVKTEYNPADGLVYFYISDTGSGIPPEYIEKVFEPFFATKDSGERIGLGLAIVRSIIKEHGGSISIASAADKETTVTIALPATGVKGGL
ncbi:MAG: PhnD/SsuA/transferrin family substrate-binding protein [Candidatus Omnitrophica bacterium]|nr:PhnD/SsuA/transferrin family substrate-binding protein [Candidatus Omnitrophota bacterium]